MPNGGRSSVVSLRDVSSHRSRMFRMASGVVGLAVVYAALLAHVNVYAPEPYMDEIFHVPQAQKYCQGEFGEWDSKITTFPGLYVTATLSSTLGMTCSLANLRSLNVLFAIGSAFLVTSLRRQIVPLDEHALLHALMITLFPINFFFSFLFYTDAGAIFFVLLMYYFALRVDLTVFPSLRRSYVPSALCGAVAVLFRQTNILWVLFVTGTIIVRCLELSHGNYIYGSPKKGHRIGRNFVISTKEIQSARQVLVNFIVVLVTNAMQLVTIVWPFILVILSFTSFLLYNGGIVVGDKSSHEVSFHAAQLLYFTVVAASGFGLSLIQPETVQNFLTSIQRNGKTLKGCIFLIASILGAILAIRYGTYVHKFMLADNRHYIFYVWHRFFLRHAMAKYVPLPLYLYCGWMMWTALRQVRTPLWKLVYAIAVALTLVPSPLVEMRYFLLPFIMLHLNVGSMSMTALWSTIAVYFFVNAVTLYIFLHRPYEWVDGSTGRFMW